MENQGEKRDRNQMHTHNISAQMQNIEHAKVIADKQGCTQFQEAKLQRKSTNEAEKTQHTAIYDIVYLQSDPKLRLNTTTPAPKRQGIYRAPTKQIREKTIIKHKNFQGKSHFINEISNLEEPKSTLN